MPSFAVDRMLAPEEPAVIAMLARAFYDDPLFGYFVPNLLHQTKGLLGFMSGAVKDARPFGEVWVAHTDDGKIAATAVWLPPGSYPRSPQREVLTNMRAVPAFARARGRVRASLKLLAAVDKAHKDVGGPHFYLAVLGSDPLYQRTGAGSAAVAPVLRRCDEEGLPAYLETQKEANLAYYARHRFEVVRKLEVATCPPIWTLRRDPK
jgi:GNAT superfamily N-acetyltransferase